MCAGGHHDELCHEYIVRHGSYCFDELKNSSPNIALAEICEFLSGYAWSAKRFSNQANGIPIIRIQNLGDNPDAKFIYWPDEFDEKFIIQKGELLLSLSGSIKVDLWKGPEALLNQRIVKIAPGEKIDKFYLIYWLQSKLKEITDAGKHALVNYVSITDIKNLQIPLPPLPEQRAIAARLSRVEQAIQKRKQSLALLDEYVKSTFLEMFGDPVRNEKGWEVKQIKEVASVKIGPFGSILHAEDYVKEGTPLINPSHINNEQIIPNPELTVSSEKLNSLRQYQMQLNDIIMGRRGEMGRCALVKVEHIGYLCGTGSLFIRPNSDVNPMYLLKTLSSGSIRRILENEANGITMMNLNTKIIENLSISFPPLLVQAKFEEKIKFKSEIVNKLKFHLSELETLYQSLMAEAFG